MIVSSHPKIGYSAILVSCFALLFALKFLTVGSHSQEFQENPADLSPVQCFGDLRIEKSPYFSLTLLQRDGGVACVVNDNNAESLIAKECQVGRFCVITAATATNCRSESPTPEAIKAGFVPLSGCKMLSGVTAARGEIKTVKPITKDSTPVLADTASPNATDSKAGTPSFAETANFILTTNKSWSSVNFDGVWSTKITNYNQAKCSVDIETHFGVFLIAQGTLNLNGLRSWKGTPMTVYDGSRNQIRYHYAAFTIEKDGSVFKGKFKQANFKDAASMLISQTFDSCSDRCSFAVPSDSDWARTKKAVNYLFDNFCAPSKPDPF